MSEAADRDAMRLSPLDNVATVLRPVEPGRHVPVHNKRSARAAPS